MPVPAGPWGRPPPPGAIPQQHHPHHTLAQRLRALNLADRHDAPRFPVLRRRYHSKFMDHEEIEGILHMQWKPLHMGPLYVEDYYYQAFVYKHYNRRNKGFFAPESVRELDPTEKVAPDQVAFVKLEGLGKVPFFNIRRPRPLMDLAPHAAPPEEGGSAAGKGGLGEGEADGKPPARPLEQEPLLAARIMIEDCMALLLDVEDIHRIFVAAAAAGGGAGVENLEALQTRRLLLLEGFAASLRLPKGPTGRQAQQQGGAGEKPRSDASDGVFMRLMSLPKGKTLTARALRLVFPPPEMAQLEGGRSGGGAEDGAGGPPPATRPQTKPSLRVVWAVLRNLRSLFDGKAAASRSGKDAAAFVRDDVAAASKLASCACSLLAQLPEPQAVLDCMAAVLAGDVDGAELPPPENLLLPLFPPGVKPSDPNAPWLANLLEALLQRAAELDLAPDASAGEQPAGSDLAQRWQQQFDRLYGLLRRHLGALREAFQAGREMGDAAGCEEVRGLLPIGLIRGVLRHCSAAQQEETRALLAEFSS